MYGFNDVFDLEHELHHRWPWARDSLASFLAAVTTEERGGFPCTFARGTIKRKSLYFAFADNPDCPRGRAEIRASLVAYLERWKTLPKAEEHLHVFLVFFAPEAGAPDLARHHAAFWNIMKDWQREDPSPWPADTPTDPDAPYWSMCYAGVQLFVNVSSPAHRNRLSRNLGRSLILVTQPRQSFDIVAGADKSGNRLRAEIRRRVDQFDRIPAASCLGTYSKGELEWPQYAIQDKVEDDARILAAGCPITHSPMTEGS